ncbi:MAG: hypothetical protein AAF317_14805, partial [Pseudomonadota bacterium]
MELLSALDGLSPWWWVAIALGFAAAELLTFSYFLLWLSLASVTVAGLLWAMPDLSGLSQLATWAVSAIGYTVVGWKVFGKRRENEPLSALNNRAAALIARDWLLSSLSLPIIALVLRVISLKATDAPIPKLS